MALQILCEALLQVVAEVACELGLEGVARLADRTRRQRPLVAMVGYGVVGAGIGVASLYWFPALFIHKPIWQIVNLILTPLLAGVVMAGIGEWRGRHKGAHTQLSTFLAGFAFAVGMAAVRYVWARGM